MTVNTKSSIKPFLEIIKGFYSFKSMLEARKQLSAESLYKIIQGTFSRKAVLASIEYQQEFASHQKTLNNWLENAPKDKLKNFLSYTTGSMALRDGQVIKITFPLLGDGLKSHTCFDGLEIPQNLDAKTIIESLNDIKPNEGFTDR